MTIIKKEEHKCPGFKRRFFLFWQCKWIYKGMICMHPEYLGVAIPFCPSEGSKPKKILDEDNS